MGTLSDRIGAISRAAGAESVAVAFHDFETDDRWDYQGGVWFHAASTIKIAILFGVYGAIQRGRFKEDDPVQVRNRFFSLADRSPFRVASSRDANAQVHAALGKVMSIRDLAFHMIVTSSNLATNLLLDLVGVDSVKKLLAQAGVQGVELVRGVEDEKAYLGGMSNRATAHGLNDLLELLHAGDFFWPELQKKMVEIMAQQRFNSGIPAGLPPSLVRQSQIAHKTGEISTVAHDAGLVYLPDRRPYALSILTQWSPKSSRRHATIANISRAVYEHFVDRIEVSP